MNFLYFLLHEIDQRELERGSFSIKCASRTRASLYATTNADNGVAYVDARTIFFRRNFRCN